MKKIAMRTMNEGGAPKLRGAFEIAGAAMKVSVIVASIIGATLGGSAAADESAGANIAEQPISLAGRWSGPHYGYGRQGSSEHCAGGCALTYDIVACKAGWCGIVVNANKTCGPVDVRLAADVKADGGLVFKGKLQIAKGSAPYIVKAWYRSEDSSVSLHFLGDTGPELLMMRRSFPFEADLARTGDATCTLEKATS
jgi:hypothetical protein